MTEINLKIKVRQGEDLAVILESAFRDRITEVTINLLGVSYPLLVISREFDFTGRWVEVEYFLNRTIF